MNPTILAVDDDPQVLAAVSRDLRTKYGEHFRIVRASSGAEAMEAVNGVLGRGGTIAAFVADQRMPAMTGTQFLREAMQVFPGAKKVLLTAYADTEAAITAINDVGLDHYLMKPWDPPEQSLYPVLDELLDDWRANQPATFDGIRVAGLRWSADAHAIKDFLARNQIPYQFLDVERDVEAEVAARTAGNGKLPVVFLPDGTTLVDPDTRSLAGAVGLQTEATNPFYDLVILGAGPAGLGAGVYGGSEGLRTLVVEKEAVGGQAGTSSRIENYLGFPQGISGGDLARRAYAQARKFGTEILTAVGATNIRVEGTTKVVTLDNGTEISCHAVVLATGMTIRRLKADGVDDLLNAGVYYGAAPSEAVAYDGEHVYVVGGANSAGQAAMMLSRFAGRVTMLIRGDNLESRMSQYLVDQINANPVIDVRFHSAIASANGDGRLESLTLRDVRDDSTETVTAGGLFIFIGAVPHSGFAEGTIAMDKQGFVLTGELIDRTAWPLERDPFLLETSTPGIFAAGDVRAGVVRRVASAVGQGAVCVSFVHRYLETV